MTTTVKEIEEKQPDFFAGINKIVNYFTRTKKGGFLFCSSDKTPVQRQVIEIVINRASQRKLDIKELYLSREDSDMFLPKVKTLAGEKPNGIVISNLDELIFATKDRIIKDINLSRDILLKLEVPFLLCMSRENISKFANQASDLFLRRDRGVVYFPDIPGKKDINEIPIYPDNIYRRHSGDVDGLRLKISMLERQLKEAEGKKYRPERIASEIAVDLIDAYIEAPFLDDANGLYEKYRAYFNLDDNEKAIRVTARLHSANLQYDRALELLRKAKVLYESAGDQRGIAFSLHFIGTLYTQLGDMKAALESLLDSKRLYEEIGDYSNMERLAVNIGKVHDIEEEWDKALLYYFTALKIVQEMGNRGGQIGILGNIGHVYRAKGELEKADEYFSKRDEILSGKKNKNKKEQINPKEDL
jgi:tetratricopeptide (TPR) repeat protein